MKRTATCGVKPRRVISMCCSVASAVMFACEDRGSNQPPAPAADRPATPVLDRPAPDMPPPAKTPIDQSQSRGDLNIVSEIRKSILDAGVSVDAQNCKVIVENGVVTLRGQVASQAEKDSVESLAKAVPGVTRVDNMLEVRPQ